jgi:hypothetical protein
LAVYNSTKTRINGEKALPVGHKQKRKKGRSSVQQALLPFYFRADYVGVAGFNLRQ